MHQLTLLFLYALLVDGVACVADVASGGRSVLLRDASGFVSLFVLFSGLMLFAASVFTPRVPKRIVLPPVIFVAFCIVWGVLFGTSQQVVLSLAEALLALGLLTGYRGSGGGLQDYAGPRPAFTLRNFLISAPVFLLVMTLTVGLSTLAVAQKLRCKVEASVGKYITVQRDGVALEERRFRQGDREIRLIGMIHVASPGFYDEVAKTLPADANAVVLVEGITDHQSVLAGKLDYSQLAGLVGVSSQRESSFSMKTAEGLKETRAATVEAAVPLPVEYRSGDIDAAEFSPATVRCIRALQQILRSTTLREALLQYNANKAFLEADAETVYKDILDRRNEHLLGEVQKMLQDHRTIIIPWGAKHMPGLQKEIERWGFVETGRAQRTALQFQNRLLVGMIALMDWLPGDLQNAE